MAVDYELGKTGAFCAFCDRYFLPQTNAPDVCPEATAMAESCWRSHPEVRMAEDQAQGGSPD